MIIKSMSLSVRRELSASVRQSIQFSRFAESAYPATLSLQSSGKFCCQNKIKQGCLVTFFGYA